MVITVVELPPLFIIYTVVTSEENKMIRVISVTKNPLSNLTNEELEKVLNQIESKKGTILHITSDSDEYTIIYRENKQLNS